MTKIDIFSGFLGAGKTTLIKKLIKESFAGQKVVLIENEFGEIGIDGGFLKESGIQINETERRLHLLLSGGRFPRRPAAGGGAVPPGPHRDRALRRGQAE